ncbi:DNA repair protein rad9 [Cercospora zeina]
MPVLTFALSPDATERMFELLQCLAKFGDAVSVEAKGDKFTLTALNSSRTAYASFALDATSFFIDYDFDANNQASGGDRFTCQLNNRALQSVFKGRAADPRRPETLIERCNVSVHDGEDSAECRFVVKMLSKHGMTKTYRLTYESVEVMHALFDKAAATQGFRVSSRILREYSEHFGPKTEQLDMVAQEGRALLQPLETAIAIHTEDFEDFHMQQDLHIVINVNDFRAIAIHAETLRGPVTARFSQPNRPLQFEYQNFGMHSEFTLMTTGDRRGGSSAPAPNVKYVSTRANGNSSSRQPSIASMQGPVARPSAGKPLSNESQRPTLRNQVSKMGGSVAEDEDPDPDSLFVPDGGDGDDQAWDAPNYDNDRDEMLGWDASNDNFTASMRPTIRDLSGGSTAQQSGRSTHDRDAFDARRQADLEHGIDPTQRLSQLGSPCDCCFVTIKLVAHPAKIALAVPDTAIWFQRPLISPFWSVGVPQLPCSPQPQAKTRPSSVRPRQCSLPAAMAFRSGRSGGGSCP